MSFDGPVTQQEFHRRRAELEMERALVAKTMSVSLIHLELAKIHREQRERLMSAERSQPRGGSSPRIFRTDKEG